MSDAGYGYNKVAVDENTKLRRIRAPGDDAGVS